MPTFKSTGMVKDRPFYRAAQVTITALKSLDGLDVEALAPKAWRSVNKTITIGDVTVKVRGFRR
jgi:hypothetical protein